MFAADVTVGGVAGSAGEVSKEEYRGVLQMGMDHLGRVVACAAPAAYEETEYMLLFLVTKEGVYEDGEEVLEGVWLREVVKGGIGKEVFWVEDQDRIVESNVLCRKGENRSYRISLKLCGEVSEDKKLLWRVDPPQDLAEMQQLGKEELERVGKRIGNFRAMAMYGSSTLQHNPPAMGQKRRRTSSSSSSKRGSSKQQKKQKKDAVLAALKDIGA